MCPVWMQKAGAGDPANPQPVFWDYHVVSITKVVVDNNNGGGGGGGLIVRDFDSVLPWGAEAGVYFDESFVNPVRDMRVKGLGIKEEFKPRFFVVPGKEFLATFSSDRSHMRKEGGGWMAEPPSWEPILSKEEGRGGNLQEYIAAKVEGVNGIEMGVEELMVWIEGIEGGGEGG